MGQNNSTSESSRKKVTATQPVSAARVENRAVLVTQPNAYSRSSVTPQTNYAYSTLTSESSRKKVTATQPVSAARVENRAVLVTQPNAYSRSSVTPQTNYAFASQHSTQSNSSSIVYPRQSTVNLPTVPPRNPAAVNQQTTNSSTNHSITQSTQLNPSGVYRDVTRQPTVPPRTSVATPKMDPLGVQTISRATKIETNAHSNDSSPGSLARQIKRTQPSNVNHSLDNIQSQATSSSGHLGVASANNQKSINVNNNPTTSGMKQNQRIYTNSSMSHKSTSNNWAQNTQQPNRNSQFQGLANVPANISTYSLLQPQVMFGHNQPGPLHHMPSTSGVTNRQDMPARFIPRGKQRGNNRGGPNNRFNRGQGRGSYNNTRGRSQSASRGSLSNASSMESINSNHSHQHNQQSTNRARGNNRQNQGRAQGTRFFGFKKLEELIEKNPEEALMILANNMDGVLNYLKANEMSPDVIVLIFEVLACVIQSTFHENVARLLLVIRENDIFATAKKYIMELPLADSAQKNKGRRFWNDYNQFFLNVALILDAMIEVLPATAVDLVPGLLKAIIYSMPNIENEHRINFSDEVCTAYDNVQVKMAQLLETKEKEVKKKERMLDDGYEEPPPNDFHDIDVYPTAQEITTRSETYLRKNVIKGAYNDVYHYLDVQYRLLREDFVAPLRDGICEYFEAVNDKERKRLSNIKIYTDVRCLGVVPNVNQVGFQVQVFKPKQKNMRNLENSRRFMFGSLVCLTSDNFTTIIFGKIIDRDKKYLVEGQLVLGFDVGVELRMTVAYTMVECTIYFEPYYQVLSALKMMKEERFPFKEYLVDVRTEPELPGYLAAGTQVDVEKRRAELNPSQLQAYTAAMMSKFCIIQGPPGTGKTYLALKVAHELLERKNVWNRSDNGAPMLVICYTNHALDQFLEGLLCKTQNLVRVGGQSKNERLKELNLRNLRTKGVPRAYFERQRESKDAVHACSMKLSRYASQLKMINDYSSVLRFDDFIDEGIDPQLADSWFSLAEHIDILEWLLVQPDNRNQVKYDDFNDITERINHLRLEENQQNTEGEEEEFDEDNPLDGQMKQNQLDIDVDEDLAVRYISPDSLYDVKKQRDEITKLANLLRDLQSRGLENDIEYLLLMRKVIKMHINYDYVCQQLRMLSQLDREVPILADYENPSTMRANDRWLLYGNWVRRYRAILQEKYVQQDLEYRNLYTQFSEVKDMLDLYKLKHVDVIGMTTTGAARLHKTLQALGCPIVIVEEAAEVLEAHIITALSPNCQHLILIGDHKQLKPSTADYKITKHYNLGVSLFERMVDNGLHCHMLDVQHRMRPEIANLVCPAIYPVLHNHESVTLYPNVRGIDSPLYFITHDHREKESQDRSKENHFEAEYLIQLARYLVLNNYDASKITIIAAYSGQWFVLLALKKKHHILRDMRICILDNFQGEENDIILLSLVRNNEQGKVGFLNLENRICVALSRAKIGMYIMGNMDQLCAAEKKIWPQVKSVLEKYDAIGRYLTVRCENHKEVVTHIQDVKDFNKVPEGGCLKICDKPLVCGHTCVKLCHSTSHENYKCNQPCTRILCEFGHQCPDRCFEECAQCKVLKFATLPCGHSKDIFCHQSPEEVQCVELVHTTLPCGHQTDKPCYADVEKFCCPHPCEARVEPCGHACTKTCHVRNDPNHEKYKCTKRCPQSNRGCQMPEEMKHNCQKMCWQECDLCMITLKKQRSCDHFYDVACHTDVENVECRRPCKKKLDCGHKCPKNCNETCGGCKIKVSKVISECGHTITKWECGLEPRKKDCKNKKCSAILPCGHACPLKCAEDCGKAKCMELVSSSVASPCNHALMVPCHMRYEKTLSNELLSHCPSKCTAVLSCGHACPGTCGQCAQGRFHASCMEKCDRTLICGHGCTTPCASNCKPCERPCQYRCEHSMCTKQCGAPCTKCKEDCGRRCQHQTCRKKCGEICSVPPCDEPCPEVLGCGHPCIGFCGDACPPLCRVCDEDEVTEFFFGTEDEEDARFVYLPDCKHTLESSGLDRWFQTVDEEQPDVAEVKVLVCPKCKTNVQALRYRDQIKKAYQDIQIIKSNYFGHPLDLKELSEQLKKDIAGNNAVYNGAICRPVIMYLEDNMKVTKNFKRHDNSKAGLTALRARMELFVEMAKVRFDGQNVNFTDSTAKQLVDDYLQFLFRRLTSVDESINDQQIEEFQAEIMRFNRIMQLGRVLNQRPHAATRKEYAVCYDQVFTYTKFSAKQNDLVHVLMETLKQAVQSTLAISDVERKQIVTAIGLSPGHWFKCANGHIYAIGECGGAMEEGKCPECGLKIGGRQHTLTSGNQLATEMANATRPAYPTINNIGLYQL